MNKSDLRALAKAQHDMDRAQSWTAWHAANKRALDASRALLKGAKP